MRTKQAQKGRAHESVLAYNKELAAIEAERDQDIQRLSLRDHLRESESYLQNIWLYQYSCFAWSCHQYRCYPFLSLKRSESGF